MRKSCITFLKLCHIGMQVRVATHRVLLAARDHAVNVAASAARLLMKLGRRVGQ